MQDHGSTRLEARFWAKVDRNGPIPSHCPELGPCWVWTASLTTTGYGQIRIRPRTRKAHQVSWEFAFGAVPDDLCVLHRCDVRPCVRPTHLFLGTIGDNQRDMQAKGRNVFQRHPERRPRGERHGRYTKPERTARGLSNGAYTRPESRARGAANGAHTHPEQRRRGETHGMAKLAQVQVTEIANKYSTGEHTQRGLAREFGVSQRTVWRIVNGLGWTA